MRPWPSAAVAMAVIAVATGCATQVAAATQQAHVVKPPNDQSVPSPTPWPPVPHCDIVVAGGSTAALAAGITAAESAPELIVCLTEPTDWYVGARAVHGCKVSNSKLRSQKNDVS